MTDIFANYVDWHLNNRFGGEPYQDIYVNEAFGNVQPKTPEQSMEVLKAYKEGGYAIAKGVAQGELGTLGELEHLGRGLLAIYNTPEGKSKVDSFLAGLQEKSILPDTETMKKLLNKIIPEVQKEYQMEEGAAEMIAPGAVLTGIAAKGVKALKKAKGAVIAAPAVNRVKYDAQGKRTQ